MAEEIDWEIPEQAQPKPGEFAFDLDRALQSIVGIQATIPDDAFTAQTLGTQRGGSGVVIRDSGLIVTIGYLITEAETVWITTADGRATPGTVAAYDQETGFGLVQALGRLGVPAMPIGQSAPLEVGSPLVVAAGTRRHSVSARVIARQEFPGSWEYLLDEALFTAPAHPFWGGAAAIDQAGKLVGIGSLHVQQSVPGSPPRDINMIVPIDLLTPILDELLTYGRPNHPARPWIGAYAGEGEGRVVIAGVLPKGPASSAGVRVGDIVLAVRDEAVGSLADFYRKLWESGSAGVEIPIELVRDGRTVWVRVKSRDRSQMLKKKSLQ
ncbi:MAG TPA: S1C family serine protease [Stellaceae bacterium]|jgi:S1-C subfamily serine protease|nr:S1C family serine protease [Stellaceae bacterium]